MSFVKQTAVVAILGLMASSGAAFAQAGGPDVPSSAKKAGTIENGPSSTGMSKGQAMKGNAMKGGAMKGGAMSKGGGMKKHGSSKM